jgi:hypothetical protein
MTASCLVHRSPDAENSDLTIPLLGTEFTAIMPGRITKILTKSNILFLREVAIVRLFNLFSRRFYLQNIGTIAKYEFKTIAAPTVFDLIRYSRFVMRNGEGYPGSRFFGMGVLNGIFERRRSLGVGLAQL